MTPVRVRFAPSPTGGLHIGGLRTALYNHLLARRSGGTMILRIEDTDQSRFVEGAEEYIVETLQWAGIQIDEGPVQGGPFGPYRQSERKAIYRRYAQELLTQGKAYYAFDSPEDLETMRERLRQAGSSSLQYDHSTRGAMRNSLTLPEGEVQELLKTSNYVIRMKVEPGQTVSLQDLIRGHVEFDSGQVDDKVLMKSDGMPTYHLANVVDDHLMQITHVIRGEEWLPSAPLHVLLYRAFGWEDTMPSFAHLPLLLRPDGGGKLSKRDADQLGFPIFPLDWKDPRTGEKVTGYREAGYLPDALINFLAFLGWNPGTEQEIFSMDELTQTFSLERIGKAGARFDIQKAQWFNQHYLRAMDAEALAGMLEQQAIQQGWTCNHAKALAIVRVLRDRITFPSDLGKQGVFFFEDPWQFDESVIAKKWNAQAREALEAFAASLPVEQLTAEQAQQLLESACFGAGIKAGQILQLLRVFLTGASGGPDLMASMAILGSTACAQRIRAGIASAQAGRA